MGDLDGGHYTTDLKSKRNNKWYNINDELVKNLENVE